MQQLGAHNMGEIVPGLLPTIGCVGQTLDQTGGAAS